MIPRQSPSGARLAAARLVPPAARGPRCGSVEAVRLQAGHPVRADLRRVRRPRRQVKPVARGQVVGGACGDEDGYLMERT